MRACEGHILHQDLVISRFSHIQPSVYPYPYLSRLFDVPGALEGRRLKDNEPLRVPAALPDSCEFHVQSVDEVVPNSPFRCIIPPSRYNRQCFPTGLSLHVVLYYPTDMNSMVGVNPFSVDNFDPPVLPRGNVTGHISFSLLAISRCGLLFLLLLLLCICSP